MSERDTGVSGKKKKEIGKAFGGGYHNMDDL